MLIYRNGNFYRQFGEDVYDLPVDHEHYAGCESLRSECATLETIGLAAHNSGLFRYQGVQIDAWWDDGDKYAAKLLADYVGPRSAWVYVLECADSAGFANPAEWIAAVPSAADEIKKFGDIASADASGPEWQMSASVKGAKTYA